MFTAEFEPAADDPGRRRAPRAAISLDTQMRLGRMGRALCRVIDISTHGARIMTYSPLKRGRAIWITLPGIGQCIADIMWAGEFEAGCQFRTPLDQAIVEALLAEGGSGPEQPQD